MLIQKIYPVEFPVGVQSSPFRVAFLSPVESLQVERLTSLVGQQVLDETSNSFNAIFNKRYVLLLQFLAIDLIGTKDTGQNNPDC